MHEFDVKNFINGSSVDSSSHFELCEPSTGQVYLNSVDASAQDVDAAVAAATVAAQSWRKVAVHDRAIALRRLSVLIMDNQQELGRLESQQTGKPLTQGLKDAELAARYFDFYASAVESLHGTTVPLSDNHHVFTTWEPHGVTAHIIPWNYPLQILARSVAPALAMGNCCVLKPAEQTPLTAIRLAQLALEAGIPSGAFNVVVGLGETTGASLANHPGIGHISFTGSVEVGRIIATSAAQNLIPVTLELGGKSPNIVFADANLERAVPALVNAILQNAGQTCSAGSRLIVHASIRDELVAKLVEKFEAITVGPALSDRGMGPLISQEQLDRVMSFMEVAKDEAKILTGGERLVGAEYGEGYFVQPTIIDNVEPDSRLGQEEIFGPVLVVHTFETMEEAIAIANGTEYGLVAGVWTQDISVAHRMVKEVVSGQVFVNTYGASGGVELPFGGFKKSGFGREKGFEGLKGFAAVKTAVVAL